MTNATETNAVPKLVFESVTCSRCGGSGRYSYCQMAKGIHGPYTCFKCKGHERTLTKRGEAASKLLTRACSKPAKDLKEGDLVKDGGKWAKVVRAYQQTAEDNTGWTHGPEGPVYSFCVETTRCQHCFQDVNKMFRVAQSAERKAEVMPLVAEYQELLTKAGKPRKAHEVRVHAILEELGVTE